MDMMSMALASASVWTYLHWRAHNFAGALFAASWLAVAAGMTHLNGGVLAVSGLAAFVFCLDRKRFRLWHLALPAVTGATGLGCWMLYALCDLPAFKLQFGTASGGHLVGLREPLRAIWKEVMFRYLPDFGFGSWNKASAHIYIILPLAYVAVLVCWLAIPAFRRRPSYLALLVWTLANLSYEVFFDWLKNEAYITYMVPLWTVLLALTIHWCWTKRTIPRSLVATAVACLFLLEVARDARPIQVNTYHNSYLPAIDYLVRHTTPATTITGSAELGFGLGFRDTLYDDIWTGCRNGRRTDLIVLSENYQGSMVDFRTSAPDVAVCQEDLLKNQYRQVYNANGYMVYARRTDGQ